MHMTDMTVSNVMGTKTAGKIDKTQKTTGLVEEFAGILNQNQQSFLDTASDYFSSDAKNSQVVFSLGSIGSTDGSQADYGHFSQVNRQISQAADSDPSSSVSQDQIQDLAQSVEDTVKETMQVDDSELEAAMDELGLTAVDLLQPQNLMQLLQNLAGVSDVSGLLTNESFQSTLQNVNELLAAFQQDNGLNQAGFEDLLAQLSQNIDELAEAVEDLLAPVEEPAPETELIAEPVDESDLSQAEDTVAAALGSQENLAGAEGVREVTQTQETDAQQPLENQTATVTQEAVSGTDQAAPEDGQELSGSSEDDRKAETAADQNQEDFSALVSTTGENTPEVAVQAEIPQTQEQSSYVQIQNLMDQMEGLARTFASSEGTTVEMQLNPENLGRLTLSVSEKQGNVTAQIIASNEQVKEALQTQLVELRSTLQNQGVRVQAVEVTVASHEFEQNLDGNASAQEQGREAHGQETHQRRNLDLNNLDELSGLMSEEETLAATMMRDNGGSVDYTA
jgi:flagellar hook-length control protein FliK